MRYLILSCNEREWLKCAYQGETPAAIAAAVRAIAAVNGDIDPALVDVSLESDGGTRETLNIDMAL